MSIVSWIVLGAVVGLSGARLRPGRFPGGGLGAAATGGVGAFVVLGAGLAGVGGGGFSTGGETGAFGCTAPIARSPGGAAINWTR